MHAMTEGVLRHRLAGRPAIQLQLPNQRAPRDAENVGGFLLMASGLSQDFKNRVLLEPVERVTAGLLGSEGGRRPLARDLVGQVAWPDFFSRTVDRGSGYHVTQLAHVAGPGIALQYLDGFRRKTTARVVLLQKEACQRPDIFRAFPQRRNPDLDGIQPVVKVGSELPPLYGVFQVDVG